MLFKLLLVIFQIYLIINQIITKYIITFIF
jgi:hypothetical protein